MENYTYDPAVALNWFIGIGFAVIIFGFFLMIKLYRKANKVPSIINPSFNVLQEHPCCKDKIDLTKSQQLDVSWMANPKFVVNDKATSGLYKSDIIATVLKDRYQAEATGGLGPNKPKPKRKPKKKDK